MKSKYTFRFGTRMTNKFTLMLLLLVLCSVSFSQVTYTFTNASATGSAGPSQAQINAAYLATNLNGSVIVTGGIQSWTVPVSGNYRIEARGAQGAGSFGGLGASMAGDFNLTAGQVLKILVGQAGTSFNSDVNIGGGGGSYVVSSTNTILVIAGGGGAARALYSEPSGTTSVNGQAGNFTGATVQGTGGVNGTGGGGASCRGGGGAGWLSAGGVGGCGAPAGQGGTPFLSGGFGGGFSTTGAAGGFGGGGSAEGSNAVWTYAGGGGGYSGGGGASEANTSARAGGGGSINNGTNQTNTSGSNSGNGKVLITRLCNFALGTTSGSNLLCSGSSVTFTTDAISNYSWSTGATTSSISVSPTISTSYTLTAMSPSNCMTSAVITITVSGTIPSLTLTASSPSVCLNNTVSLSASGAITYTWSGGVNNGVAFTPSATSNYTVVGQNGCGTVSAVQTISVLPLPVIGLATPSLICSGSTTTLNAGGATNYTWQPGNIVGNIVFVSPVNTNNYTVTGSAGNCIGVYTVIVATNPNPTITASASNSMICVGETVTLTAGGGLSYTWQPGGQTGSSIVVTPTAPTGYVVTGLNSFNCSSSANQAVIAFPSPTVLVSASSQTICQGGTSTLTASGANTYSWNTGASSAVTVVNPANTTVYSVTGTSSNNNCSSTSTISVSVFAATISVTSPTSVCLGQSVTLNATGANSYQWNTGNTNSSILVSPVTTTGYTVNGVTTVGSNTCASSGTTQVTVNPLPVVTASATRTLICKYESTTLTAGGASTYVWNTSATTSTVLVTPLVSTFYTVVGTSSLNCSATATIYIRVTLCENGISESSNQNSMLHVYPNPNNGEFTIQAEDNMDLRLVDAIGQVVVELKLSPENNFQINVRGINTGIYFLKSMRQEFQYCKKIVIEK